MAPRAGKVTHTVNKAHSDLLENVKFALAAEMLDCKPIRGVDLPLQLMGTGELLEVEQLDRLETVHVQLPPLRLDDNEKVLAMLLPSQL